jgi:hypothetical protein
VTEPHFTWLHGPVKKPDPRVGDMSASAANRHRPGVYVWDHWMNEPIRNIQPPTEPEEAA